MYSVRLCSNHRKGFSSLAKQMDNVLARDRGSQGGGFSSLAKQMDNVQHAANQLIKGCFSSLAKQMDNVLKSIGEETPPVF